MQLKLAIEFVDDGVSLGGPTQHLSAEDIWGKDVWGKDVWGKDVWGKATSAVRFDPTLSHNW